MQIEHLTEVADIMAAELRPRARVWIVGIARLVDLADAGGVTAADAQRLVSDARQLGFYPLGRAAYLPASATPTSVPEYEAAAVQISMGEPHNYRGIVGLGSCRDLAVADSYQLEVDDRNGVLLSDMEAAVADLLILAYTRALHVDYRGRIDLLMTLADDGVQPAPGLWRVDESSGAVVPTGRHTSDIEPIRFSASTTSTFEELFEAVRGASCEVALGFGVNAPQLIPKSDSIDVEVEIRDRRRVLEERHILPLHERD